MSLRFFCLLSVVASLVPWILTDVMSIKRRETTKVKLQIKRQFQNLFQYLWWGVNQIICPLKSCCCKYIYDVYCCELIFLIDNNIQQQIVDVWFGHMKHFSCPISGRGPFVLCSWPQKPLMARIIWWIKSLGSLWIWHWLFFWRSLVKRKKKLKSQALISIS